MLCDMKLKVNDREEKIRSLLIVRKECFRRLKRLQGTCDRTFSKDDRIS